MRVFLLLVFLDLGLPNSSLGKIWSRSLLWLPQVRGVANNTDSGNRNSGYHVWHGECQEVLATGQTKECFLWFGANSNRWISQGLLSSE